MLGKLLFWGGVTAAVVGGAYALTQYSSASPPKNGDKPADDGKLGGWEFAEWTMGGAAADAELPTIVVLHDEGSGDADVRAIFDGLDLSARILVPLGKNGSAQKRNYVADPDKATAPDVQKAAVDLQAFLFDVLKKRRVTGRLVVVSLGTIAGTMAISLGFFAGLAVRQVYALGGLYEPAYVAQAPQAQVRIRLLFQSTLSKLAQDLTTESFKLAASRGFDNVQIQVGDFDLPVTRALAQSWLWPELAANLAKA